MSARRCAWSVVAALVLGSILVAAQPQAPQTPSGRVESGSSSITGRVVDRVTLRPIEGVLITLASVDRRRALVCYTDTTGRYEFTSIAAGDYRVVASHTDYVTTEFGL
jgi:hypothetical protein